MNMAVELRLILRWPVRRKADDPQVFVRDADHTPIVKVPGPGADLGDPLSLYQLGSALPQRFFGLLALGYVLHNTEPYSLTGLGIQPWFPNFMDEADLAIVIDGPVFQAVGFMTLVGLP